VKKNSKIRPKDARSGGDLPPKRICSEKFDEKHQDLEDLRRGK
jgi:hypothetical protein